MRKLTPRDYRIISELMKNARISDRQLAKTLGVSQPTVSRRRASLEKDVIDGYTLVPRWAEFGFEIFAITLFKTRFAVRTKEKSSAVRERGVEFLTSQPNVIMAGGCQGIGADCFSLSLHHSYSDYDEWLRTLRYECGDLLDAIQPTLVNLHGTDVLKPLHLKYLADLDHEVRSTKDKK